MHNSAQALRISEAGIQRYLNGVLKVLLLLITTRLCIYRLEDLVLEPAALAEVLFDSEWSFSSQRSIRSQDSPLEDGGGRDGVLHTVPTAPQACSSSLPTQGVAHHQLRNDVRQSAGSPSALSDNALHLGQVSRSSYRVSLPVMSPRRHVSVHPLSSTDQQAVSCSLSAMPAQLPHLSDNLSSSTADTSFRQASGKFKLNLQHTQQQLQQWQQGHKQNITRAFSQCSTSSTQTPTPGLPSFSTSQQAFVGTDRATTHAGTQGNQSASSHQYIPSPPVASSSSTCQHQLSSSPVARSSIGWQQLAAQPRRQLRVLSSQDMNGFFQQHASQTWTQLSAATTEQQAGMLPVVYELDALAVQIPDPFAETASAENAQRHSPRMACAAVTPVSSLLQQPGVAHTSVQNVEHSTELHHLSGMAAEAAQPKRSQQLKSTSSARSAEFCMKEERPDPSFEVSTSSSRQPQMPQLLLADLLLADKTVCRSGAEPGYEKLAGACCHQLPHATSSTLCSSTDPATYHVQDNSTDYGYDKQACSQPAARGSMQASRAGPPAPQGGTDHVLPHNRGLQGRAKPAAAHSQDTGECLKAADCISKQCDVHAGLSHRSHSQQGTLQLSAQAEPRLTADHKHAPRDSALGFDLKPDAAVSSVRLVGWPANGGAPMCKLRHGSKLRKAALEAAARAASLAAKADPEQQTPPCIAFDSKAARHALAAVQAANAAAAVAAPASSTVRCEGAYSSPESAAAATMHQAGGIGVKFLQGMWCTCTPQQQVADGFDNMS